MAESERFSFAEHPQFWLIPPALSVLVAAQVNRRKLAPEMLAAIRYAATIVLYLSSTSETSLLEAVLIGPVRCIVGTVIRPVDV